MTNPIIITPDMPVCYQGELQIRWLLPRRAADPLGRRRPRQRRPRAR
jgi:hypothetical protein